MCALLILYHYLKDCPILVGANRDEFYDRPFAPPRWLQLGEGRAYAPVDLRAGGAWLGVNGAGVFVAITNRPGAADAARRSRGETVTAALAAASADAARARVERRIAENCDNPFRLVILDRAAGFVMTNDGTPAVALTPGVHILTNEHGLDAVAAPALDAVRAARSRAQAEPLVRALLRDHESHDGGHRFCKHHEKRGTVSSSIITFPQAAGGAADFHYAGGAPCKTQYSAARIVITETPS